MNIFIEQISSFSNSYTNMLLAANSFEKRGYLVEFILRNNLKGLIIAEDSLFFGSVNFIHDALKKINKPIPNNIDLPTCLSPFIKRKIWASTLRGARASLNIHIKPLDKHKLFNGIVIKEFKDLISTAHLPPETKVLCSELKEFESEWRCYVLHGKIEHIGFYKGNPLVFPDPVEMARAASILYEETGIVSCGMDWAANKNESYLIEVNDSYSLGNYGCPGWLYSTMIEERWQQIIND